MESLYESMGYILKKYDQYANHAKRYGAPIS